PGLNCDAVALVARLGVAPQQSFERELDLEFVTLARKEQVTPRTLLELPRPRAQRILHPLHILVLDVCPRRASEIAYLVRRHAKHHRDFARLELTGLYILRVLCGHRQRLPLHAFLEDGNAPDTASGELTLPVFGEALARFVLELARMHQDTGRARGLGKDLRAVLLCCECEADRVAIQRDRCQSV